MNLANREACLAELLGVMERSDRLPEAVELCQEELRAARTSKNEAESPAYLTATLQQTAQLESACGRWSAAQAALEEALAIQETWRGAHDPRSTDMLRQLARMNLAQGDAASYRSTCQKLLAAFAEDARPRLCGEIVWTCVLGSDVATEPNQLVTLAEQGLKHKPQESASYRVLAAALCRAGRFAEAIDQLSEAVRISGTKTWQDQVFMCLASLGRGDEATANACLEQLSHGPPNVPNTLAAKRQLRRELMERDILIREVRLKLNSSQVAE